MKAKQTIACIFLGIMLFSCSRTDATTKKQLPISENAVEESIADDEPSKEEKRKQQLEANERDSLRLDRVLNQALSKAKSHSFNTSFKEAFQAFPDSAFHVDVEIDYDFHFSTKKRHLLIRRFSPASAQIDVYTYSNGNLKNILGHTKWAMEYTGDTLTDVNGDGLKDLIVNWYGTSGCCLKGFSSVYLVREDLHSFSKMTEFINPTFSSKERMIRGVCYGHPGETELYKFKWSGEKIDTVEYVFYERNEDGKQSGKVIVSNYYPTHKAYRELRKVSTLPSEYKRINGINWFTGELKNN